MDYDDFVQTHEINSYDELLNIITGKTSWGDLRDNYVFRGMKKTYYKMIPSSLRKDKYGNYEINKFISDEDFILKLDCTSKDIKETTIYGTNSKA